jgi:hypothetical protein
MDETIAGTSRNTNASPINIVFPKAVPFPIAISSVFYFYPKMHKRYQFLVSKISECRSTLWNAAESSPPAEDFTG